MGLNKRLLSLLFMLIMISGFVSCKQNNFGSRNSHLLELLARTDGYIARLSYTWQVPPFVFSPILILPPTNQQETANIETISSKENSQQNKEVENGVMNDLSKDSLEKISNLSNDEMKLSDDDNSDDDSIKIIRNLRQSNDSQNNSTEASITFSTPIYTGTTISDLPLNTEATKITSSGPYPAGTYNNSMIDLLTFTTEPSDGSTIHSPNDVTTNISATQMAIVNVSEIDKTMTNDLPKQKDPFSSLVANVSKPVSFYPYPAASYNNSVIDQLSITTNSYVNEESQLPPSQDDRWHNFSSLGKFTLPTYNGFRPLAGLYYDGFLHSPLYKMRGFVPYMNNGF